MGSISEVITLKRTVKKATLLIVFLFAILIFSLLASAQTSTSCPIAAYEGDLVKLSPAAFDPDPEIGPAGKLIWSFGTPFDSTGQWQTIKGMRGIFNFWVSVSDGELKDTTYSCVDVLPKNRNPILKPVSEVYLKRGESTNLQATCSDPDGDPVKIEYRFKGRNVAYIYYEPPGTYGLQVVCTDDFGGIDVEKTKLHILMPEQPKPAPKPKPVITTPQEIEVKTPSDPQVIEVKMQTPQDIELVLPKKDTPHPIEVNYPKTCPTCKPDVVEVRYPVTGDGCPVEPTVSDEKIEVVQYNTTQNIHETYNTTRFVIGNNEEPKTEQDAVPTAAPAEEPRPTTKPVKTLSACEAGMKRKGEISRALGCC